MLVLTTLTNNRKLRSRKMRTFAEALSSTKTIRGNRVKDVQKIGKSTLGKTDHKVVRNESIELESIYSRLAEDSSFAEDPPFPPNFCTDASVVQSSSSSVNTSEWLDKDDNEVLKILNEFLSTSEENKLDTFLNQKKNVTTTDKRLSGYFC